MTAAPTIQPAHLSRLTRALPFWSPLLLIPLALLALAKGGWTIAFLPLATWLLFSVLDAALGLNSENADPETQDSQLGWYRLITIVWAPLQFGVIFGGIWYVTHSDHLLLIEEYLIFAAFGVISGTIGINYSHELMHQRPKFERWLGDLLLAMVLYSHFRSEHLLVHHRYVGTPRDPVTSRYGEGFYRFFWRVLRSCPVSAFRAEKAMLARKNKPWTALSNPFWRYWALQLGCIGLAFWIGGFWGVFLFSVQAFGAIVQLELVNYVEHYGLNRRHLGEGKYEHVLPRHSWNASHRASNWLLINLQRHSDHHYKPDRRFPLLQTHDAESAPQLPYGYPVMTWIALVPSQWRKVMNPRGKAWRAQHYPDIEDWAAYNKGMSPMPR